jgi:hypothetical protein
LLQKKALLRETDTPVESVATTVTRTSVLPLQDPLAAGLHVVVTGPTPRWCRRTGSGSEVHIDKLLAERGLTLTELAARVGVTLANLSILKNGRPSHPLQS